MQHLAIRDMDIELAKDMMQIEIRENSKVLEVMTFNELITKYEILDSFATILERGYVETYRLRELLD